jgi:hypothetical protein
LVRVTADDPAKKLNISRAQDGTPNALQVNFMQRRRVDGFDRCLGRLLLRRTRLRQTDGVGVPKRSSRRFNLQKLWSLRIS